MKYTHGPYKELFTWKSPMCVGLFQVHLVKISQILALLALTVPILSSIVCVKLPKKHPHIFWE